MVKFSYSLDLTSLTLFHKIFYSILLLVVSISLKGNVWVKNVGGWEKECAWEMCEICSVCKLKIYLGFSIW